MTAIGKMRKRAAIYTRADSETGEYSASIARTLISTVWAHVINMSGTAQIDSRNAGAGVSHRITIRDRSDVSKKNEILYDGWLYEIKTIQRGDDERERFLILECNQLAALDTLMDLSPEALARGYDAEGNPMFDADGNPMYFPVN